jgi:hypothetical protein
MLNKGTLVIEALGVLDSILKRMEHHQNKKKGTTQGTEIGPERTVTSGYR